MDMEDKRIFINKDGEEESYTIFGGLDYVFNFLEDLEKVEYADIEKEFIREDLIEFGAKEDKLLCTYVVSDDVFDLYYGTLILDENNNIVARI